MASAADIQLVIGLLLVAFAIPSALGAYADRRLPFVAVPVALAGLGLMALSWVRQPYAPHQVAEAVVRVVATILN